MNSALLVVFGNLVTPAGKTLTGEFIFDSLVSNGVWITARVPKGTGPGMRIAIYQSGRGVRAFATLKEVIPTVPADARLCPGLPVSLFSQKLSMTDVHRLDEPVDLGPLVDKLSFVSNKKWWGHSIRFSPRLIPLSDFRQIIGAGSAAKN